MHEANGFNGAAMQTQVREWGNSQEIRISEKAFRHRTLEERAAEFGGKLDLDGEYGWNINMLGTWENNT